VQWTLPVIFFLLWVIGMSTSVSLGGYIHAFLGAAIAMPLAHFFRPVDANPSGRPQDRRKRKYGSGRIR